ncbi:hypothetical protein V6N13_085578 [Hibiscus sabdariffa]
MDTGVDQEIENLESAGTGEDGRAEGTIQGSLCIQCGQDPKVARKQARESLRTRVPSSYLYDDNSSSTVASKPSKTNERSSADNRNYEKNKRTGNWMELGILTVAVAVIVRLQIRFKVTGEKPTT